MSDLQDLLTDFIRAKRRQYISEKQLKALECECRKIIDWLDCTIAEVDREKIELFLDGLADNGRCARTQNKYLTSIKGLFRWADLEDRIDKNPLLAIRPRKGPKVRVRQVFNAEQMVRIAKAAESGPEWQALAVALGYYAGMRLREVKGLQWGRVDLERGMIELRPQDQKGKKHSYIPMADRLREMLAGAKEKAADISADALVLPSIPEIPSLHHRAMLERAGIPYVDKMGRVADFHALRHTCLNMMGEAGIALAWIQDFARHAKPETTRIYVRVNEDGMRKAAACLPKIG